jgi:branched-chain amino acid transport system permease protein
MGYFLTLLALFSELAIICVGAHLVVSVAGILFLGLPVMFSLGAYALVISTKSGFDLWLAVIISLLLVLLLSIFFVFIYFKLSKDSFAVFTLISVLAFDALIKSWDSVTGGVLGIAGVVRPEFISSLSKLVIFYLLLMFLFLFFEYVVLKTQFGRSLLGFKENKNLIESFGISTKKISGAVITLASLLAGIVGMLAVWRIQFLDPNFGGIMVLVQILTVAIIAVKPKVRWLVGGTFFTILLPEVLRFSSLPSSSVGHLRNLLYALLLIILLKTISKKNLISKRVI